MWQGDFTFKLSGRSNWWKSIINGGMPEAEAAFSGQLVFMNMKGRQTISIRWCFWGKLYSVYAVLGVCCTWCMLYLVYAVLSVCCTQCWLIIMALRDWVRWLHFGFRNDNRVVDEKERWEIKMGIIWRIQADMRNLGTTCLIEFGCSCISVIFLQDWTHIYHIWDGIIDVSTKFPFVLVSDDGFPHLLSSLCFLSSTLPSPKNKKLSYPSLFHQVIIMSKYRVQHTPSTVYSQYCIHQVLHFPRIDCSPLAARFSSFIPWQTLLC